MIWNNEIPADDSYEHDGALNIRELKEAITERIELDHYWHNNLLTINPDADGRHKQVTLSQQASPPDPLDDCLILYAKENSEGKVALFYITPETGEVEL